MVLGRSFVARITPAEIEKIAKLRSWSVSILSSKIGCSRSAIYRAIRAGELATTQEPGYLRVLSSSLISLWEKCHF
ncbi:MAG: hypothetical protein F4Y39_14000 [Gemmatimonadetes bacterium]|nr:hypothetical protein [Gemmatimonadota bacterium]MYC14838.1 hypothetical protein [Gemmatimonadota bacterium]